MANALGIVSASRASPARSREDTKRTLMKTETVYAYALLMSIIGAATRIETMPTTNSNARFMLSMNMNAGFPSSVITPSANMRAAKTVNIIPATIPLILIPFFITILSPLSV